MRKPGDSQFRLCSDHCCIVDQCRDCPVHCSIFWFNRFSWWLKSHLPELAEQLGEDSAVLAVSDGAYYAEVLLGFFETMAGARRRVYVHTISMARGGRATQRLDRILTDRAVSSLHLKKPAIGGLIFLMVPLVCLMAAVQPSVSKSPSLSGTSAPQSVFSPNPSDGEKGGIAELSQLDQESRPGTARPATASGAPGPAAAEQSIMASGESGTLRAIEIVGSTSFSQAVLESQLKTVRLNGMVAWDTVSYDIETNLKLFLKEHGFLQSEVQWSLLPLAGRNVALHLHITEGPQYHLTVLTIKGTTAFTPEEVSAKFDLHSGDVANIVKINNGLEQIKKLYADRGFINLSYIPEMVYDPPKGTMALILTFLEGIQFRVGYVGFVGCSDQAEEDRLRTQVDIHPGDIYSVGKEKAVLADLKKFGVIKDTVEILDEGQGLIGIAFWLQRPR